MLESLGVPYAYREYREEPLSRAELEKILELLGREPRDLLRPKEAAAQGLSGETPRDELLGAMVEEPTLVQRPIAILEGKALLARPADLLTAFLGK